MDLDSSFQRFVSQYYMPCPKPEHASGALAHSDQGLLTIVTDNGISGLQTLHNGKWVKLCPPPNAVMVSTCDQLEILTNGKYKSNVHRVCEGKPMYVKKDRSMCAHCGILGHTKDKCYKLHDYPPGYTWI